MNTPNTTPASSRRRTAISIAAILALGELLDAGGDDLVTAYGAGVEVAGRLGRSVNDRHSQLGWHTTCTLGAVGAAAACAWLRSPAVQAHTLIHGHTHRPGAHRLADGLSRVVLSDWDASAQPPGADIRRLSASGLQRLAPDGW